MVNSNQVDFAFPVLGFPSESRLGDFENRFYGFEHHSSLTACEPKTLTRNLQLDMELVDIEGRRWMVRSVTMVGRADRGFRQLISKMGFKEPLWRVDLEVDALDRVTLEEMQDRACACVQADPFPYFHFPDEPDFDTAFAEIRATKSVRELYAWLSPLDFDCR